MAFRMFGVKPLPEAMLNHYKLGHCNWEQTSNLKIKGLTIYHKRIFFQEDAFRISFANWKLQTFCTGLIMWNSTSASERFVPNFKLIMDISASNLTLDLQAHFMRCIRRVPVIFILWSSLEVRNKFICTGQVPHAKFTWSSYAVWIWDNSHKFHKSSIWTSHELHMNFICTITVDVISYVINKKWTSQVDHMNFTRISYIVQ